MNFKVFVKHSGRSRGGCVSNPPLKQDYFIFMENFQKNQEKLMKNEVKLTNQTPFANLNPLPKNPGLAAESSINIAQTWVQLSKIYKP